MATELREVELCEGEQPKDSQKIGNHTTEFHDPHPPTDNFLTFECENFKKEDGTIAKIYNISSYNGEAVYRCIDRQDIFSIVYELQKNRATLTDDEFRIHFVLLRVAPLVFLFTTIISLFKLPAGLLFIIVVTILWVGAAYHFGTILQKSFNEYDAKVVNFLMAENTHRFAPRGVTVKHLVRYEGPRALKCFLPRRNSCIRLYMPKEDDSDPDQQLHHADITSSNIEVVSFTNSSMLASFVSKRYRRASSMNEDSHSSGSSPAVFSRRTSKLNTVNSVKTSSYEDLESRDLSHEEEEKDEQHQDEPKADSDDNHSKQGQHK
eukprot:CAMPEP_0115015932 /NCGR_PEP_ID=MMETSP0216-20121206/27094_1 /TAXON_ID=223996 /ORGANISM="Protocruzia adherens, Strain Boccale" /LENGTH=320 /DNA_ID=CAMNT_0002386209 /DNA_START=268 /DNA_END=1230 /DNA_ORIENTATION=+